MARAPPRATLAGGQPAALAPLGATQRASAWLQGCKAAQKPARRRSGAGITAMQQPMLAPRCVRHWTAAAANLLLLCRACFTCKQLEKQALMYDGLLALQDTGHGRRPLRPAATAAHRVPWRRGKPYLEGLQACCCIGQAQHVLHRDVGGAAVLYMIQVVTALVRPAVCCRVPPYKIALVAQVNDFSADAIISQLLLLDSQDPSKVC